MPTPLLMEVNDLTPVERVNLAQLKLHPGFVVLEKLFMAACKNATDAVVKLDPSEEGFERKLKALQQKARERNDFCMLILASVEWQDQFAKALEESEKPNPEPEQNRILKSQRNS